MIRSVLVAGGGSAGFLTALILKKTLPDLPVTVVRSKEIGVLGVGESTTVAVPRILHGYLDLEPGEFYRRVNPSWKLGIRFLWGPRPFFDYTFDLQLDRHWTEFRRPNGFYCDEDMTYVNNLSALMSHNKVFERREDGGPFVHRCLGYHIENQRFVGYLEAMAERRGVTIIEGVITGATTDGKGVTGVTLESGQTLTADLYVDCTGFRSLLLGKALQEPFIPFRPTLFNDRARVAAWPRTDEPIQPYTTAETMDAGWCWRIDHPDYVNRGYVYSTAFISDEDAEREFRAKNPLVRDTRLVKFVSGRYERGWVKNVVAIGNAVGFVEPLESTALAVICDVARIVAQTLVECDKAPTPMMVMHYNRLNAWLWDHIRDFLGIHFKYNTRLDTPYWRACRADAHLAGIREVIDFYEDQGPSLFYRQNLLHNNDIFGLEGYLSLLVGQKVPYRARYQASEAERGHWQQMRAINRQKAEMAYTIPEALEVVASPNCQWVPGYYRCAEDARLTNYIGTAG